MSNELTPVPWAVFEKLGFVQEINRRLLHPCGYEIKVVGGVAHVYEINSPEGGYYQAHDMSRTKASFVFDKFNEKLAHRREIIGHAIQPVPEHDLGDK